MERTVVEEGTEEAGASFVGSFSATLERFAGQFDVQVEQLYFYHALLDLVSQEREERLALWDEEGAQWYLLLAAGYSLQHYAWSENRAEGEKAAFTEQVMKDYYARLVAGEAVRNVLVEKHDAIVKEKLTLA